MADEPDIVKLLRVHEKQGKLKSLSKEKEKTDEENYHNNSNGTQQVLKDISEEKEMNINANLDIVFVLNNFVNRLILFFSGFSLF